MFCNRCNTEFPEGLRYCKWCGQPLANAGRETGELLKCPSCGDAVRTTWAFCKTCGARLAGAVGHIAVSECPHCKAIIEASQPRCSSCGAELSAGQGQATAGIESGRGASNTGRCPSCGEVIEAGSVYCKACGSPLARCPQASTDCGPAATEAPGARPKTSGGIEEFFHTARPLEPRVESGPIVFEQQISPWIPGEIHTTSGPGADPLSAGFGSGIPGAAEGGSVGPEPPHSHRGLETTSLSEDPDSTNDQPSNTSVFRRPRITGVLEVDRFQLDGAETQEAGQSATFEESSEESSATPGSAFVLAPDQHATPLPKGFNPAEELTTSKIEQPELFVASPPATPATEWATFPFVEQPAGSAHEQAEFFVEEVGVKPPEPQSEQAPLPVADHASAPVEQPCIVTPAPPPAPPPSEGTIAPPEAKSSSAPAGAAKKAELQKWDSKVRSLSGSGSKQPASAPFSPEHHPRIERDLPASVIAPRHRGGSNAGVYVAAAALVVFVVGALVVWRFALSGVVPQRGNEAGTPAPQPAAASTEAGRPAAPAPPTSGAPEGMVFVEGGLYDIGRDDADLYARPRRTVALAGFYIDRTEVTRAQYKKFVDATGRSAPEGWTDGNYPPGTDNYPVANVSWQDAADYARWAGRRLPTEAEWEAAARGKDGRIYPWGNRWRTEVANIGTNGVVEVGKFKEGASPAGALDMIGNVWEWTADEFHLYPGNTAAMPASNKLGLTYRVFRGGAYDGSEIHDASYRGFLDGSKGYPKIGFRCVKNADQ